MSGGVHLLKALPGQLHGVVLTTAVTVSGGPTLLPATALQGRKDFLVYNPDGNSGSVWVGGSGVGMLDGIPVVPGGTFEFRAGRSEVYALISGTNLTVRVIEIA